MRAMVLFETHTALKATQLPDPTPSAGEILVRVEACAVCRTDLHVVDGELPNPQLPIIPGLGRTCGVCTYCKAGMENLCDNPQFTGYTRNGGYAELTTADERFAVPIPNVYGDTEAAPLLCAGLIGFRSLVKTGDARRLGI